jgi:pentatricopeptide repeat protein
MILSSSDSLSSALFAALKSMTNEFISVFVFFATWALVNKLLRKKQGSKGDILPIRKPTKKQNPEELAAVIQELCCTHFTRALRLYRDMVKNGNDLTIVDETFYMVLVESAIRVGKRDVAIEVLKRMHTNGMVPSLGFLQSVLKLLCARKFYQECTMVFDLFEPSDDQVVYSCLSLAAAENNDIENAKKFLDLNAKIFSVSGRDYLPYLRALNRLGKWEKAVTTLHEMLDMDKHLEVDPVCLNTVISACVDAGEHEAVDRVATEVIEYQKKYGMVIMDIVSYNTRLKAAARSRDIRKCFTILDEIHSAQLAADDVTFSTLLDVCIDEDDHEMASLALEQMSESGVTMNCVLLTTMIKGFVRTKNLSKAMALFETMRGETSVVKPDMITYSILIKAHCDAGDMTEALRLLEAMLQDGNDVDDVVFTHLIDGCSQTQNHVLAEKLWNDMFHSGIKPSIFTIIAIVRVWCRAGLCDRAWQLITTMEERFGKKPTLVLYTTLISGLFRQRNCKDAMTAYYRAVEEFETDGQLVNIVLVGLSDTKKYDELMQISREAAEKKPARLRSESFGYSLNSLLTSRELDLAREYYEMLQANHVEVTVANLEKRLNRS